MLSFSAIHRIATRVAIKYPEYIRDEIYSAAVEGIVIALRRYDPTKGASIETFALAYAKGYAQKEWERWKKPFLSLDYEYESKDGTFTLAELLGKEDPELASVEYSSLVEKLAKEENEKKLLELLQEGHGIKECAKALGKSRVWVWKKLKKIKKRSQVLI
ncbi:Sigma-70 region 2 [Hydrogenobacter hydrogenophilus]|uniref:Sigma-70 region 2 n=1 Tax=Hydrogenobacter hydrogenophilus TaxID=35835 RepID=A0A285P1J9_9AQUI|nr:sigma factor [Hydrogenobacter hydrogenophilus]SNZ15612.1 Sigma-70 region 2 [Hydrogenobacter hydrogenophilus]